MKQRTTALYSLIGSLVILPQLAYATLFLAQIQPISGFTDLCQAAYTVPIFACPEAKTFVNFSGICTKECFVGLNGAATTIQKACQFAAAHGETVIAHAFKGDLSLFLCEGHLKGLGGDGNNSGNNNNGDDDNNDSNGNGNVAPTATNVITTASGISPTPVPTMTSPTSSSKQPSSSTSPSTVPTTFTQSTTSSQTSPSATVKTSSATPSSTTVPGSNSGADRGGVGNGSGSSDSTPFDQGTWDYDSAASTLKSSSVLNYMTWATIAVVSILAAC